MISLRLHRDSDAESQVFEHGSAGLWRTLASGKTSAGAAHSEKRAPSVPQDKLLTMEALEANHIPERAASHKCQTGTGQASSNSSNAETGRETTGIVCEWVRFMGARGWRLN